MWVVSVPREQYAPDAEVEVVLRNGSRRTVRCGEIVSGSPTQGERVDVTFIDPTRKNQDHRVARSQRGWSHRAMSQIAASNGAPLTPLQRRLSE